MSFTILINSDAKITSLILVFSLFPYLHWRNQIESTYPLTKINSNLINFLFKIPKNIIGFNNLTKYQLPSFIYKLIKFKNI